MNIILLGPPGAGKGTQAQLLVHERGLTQLSTGNMLRDARVSDTEMGHRVAAVMDRGDLVTDDIVIGLIEERLHTNQGAGIIFDGFPRTLPQADALGALLERSGEALDAVIAMNVDDAVLVRRIAGRYTCGNCKTVYHDETRPTKVPGICDVCASTDLERRADDTEDAFRQRLMEYYKKTSPLIGYYYAKNMLDQVDGLGEIGAVRAAIESVLTSS